MNDHDEMSIDGDGWIHIGIQCPPFDKPILVSDGKSCEVRTFRLFEGRKAWFTDSESPIHDASWWRYLPELPK